MAPAPTIIPAISKHTATVIFSHGLGDTAMGWTPFARSLKNRFKHVKWVLPTAENQPVTLNGGMPMPSWFDIKSLSPPSAGSPPQEDEAGMLKSVRLISELISAEVDAGIPANRIVVGGFSQGAVISLLTGITSERKLAGLISLSGFLGLSDKIHLMQTEHAKKLPVFWGHGTGDQVVRFAWGQASADKLQALGFDNLEFHAYPGMPHSLCDQEQADLEAWLKKVVPETA